MIRRILALGCLLWVAAAPSFAAASVQPIAQADLLVDVPRAPPPASGASARFPRPTIAPLAGVEPQYERRFFWQSVTPHITATVCLPAC